MLPAPKATAFSEPAAAFRAPALPSASTPALIVTPPVNVFAPESVSVPLPALVRPSVPPPVPFWITPAKAPLRLAALPTVRTALVAETFSTTGVPGVALEFRLPMTTLLPPRRRVPVLAAEKVTAFSDPAAALSAPAPPTASAPASMVTPPVKVFVPERVRVPADFLVRPPSAAAPSPASRSKACPMVMSKVLLSMIAPPALTFALVTPFMKVALAAVGLKVPPLKLKVEVDRVLVIALRLKVPPLRLKVPVEEPLAPKFRFPAVTVIEPPFKVAVEVSPVFRPTPRLLVVMVRLPESTVRLPLEP